MNFSKFVLGLCLCVGLALAPLSSVRADDGSTPNMTPVVTITPNLFRVGTSSNTFVTITNGNQNSAKTMQTGDSFKLTFDSNIGTVVSFESVLMVNSSTLSSADFLASAGSSANQLVITYVGTTSKLFGPGDSFCVKISVAASPLTGSGKVNVE